MCFTGIGLLKSIEHRESSRYLAFREGLNKAFDFRILPQILTSFLYTLWTYQSTMMQQCLVTDSIKWLRHHLFSTMTFISPQMPKTVRAYCADVCRDNLIIMIFVCPIFLCRTDSSLVSFFTSKQDRTKTDTGLNIKHFQKPKKILCFCPRAHHLHMMQTRFLEHLFSCLLS